MKNSKKVVATIMALGMVSTMGLSAYADTIGDSQNSFYTGDVNLDGKVNTVDLLILKKMLLGLTDMQQMYIDDDTLKLVEDTTKTVSSDDKTLEFNYELQTITIVEDGIVLNVPEDVSCTLNLSDATWKEICEESESEYSQYILFNVTYNEDADNVVTNISVVYQADVPITCLDVIRATAYTVDVENSTIHVTEKNFEEVLLDITLNVTDNTIFNAEFSSLEELSERLQDGNIYIDITYDTVTKNIKEIAQLEFECDDKPVIYLYPTEETKVDVSLDLNGKLTCTYPKYEDGWSVIAEPDGTLYDANGNEYYCLYWEGIQNVTYDMSKGFVVKGEDTADFLREKLLYMGLTPKEANEFIIYWLPRMEGNEYNLITFQDDIYTENAKLDITPTPDSMLRIFMAYQPLDDYIEIEEQELSTFERTGFCVVEWGGTEISK